MKKPPISIIETLESAIFWIPFFENEFIKLLKRKKKKEARNHLILNNFDSGSITSFVLIICIVRLTPGIKPTTFYTKHKKIKKKILSFLIEAIEGGKLAQKTWKLQFKVAARPQKKLDRWNFFLILWYFTNLFHCHEDEKKIIFCCIAFLLLFVICCIEKVL